MRRLVYFVLIALVLIAAGLLSYRHRQTTGLAGYGAGAALGSLLCGLSHFFWRAARVAEGQAVVRIVMSGLIATFGILITAVLAVRWFWPEVLSCFALTAVSLYLVHRFFEAIVAGMYPVEKNSQTG